MVYISGKLVPRNTIRAGQICIYLIVNLHILVRVKCEEVEEYILGRTNKGNRLF